MIQTLSGEPFKLYPTFRACNRTCRRCGATERFRTPPTPPAAGDGAKPL